ncbi:MAG TPA: DUF4142 domain-containing protein [Polyangia bacterium]|nr:DUF4142 domain-containing protein [Polyangia bacterium]
MTRRRYVTMATPLFMVGFALALAQFGTVQAASSGGGTAPALDAVELVPTLHRINEMEIDAGKLAQKKGSTQAMKDYGNKLQRDHQAADNQLSAYAVEAKIDVNGSVPPPVARNLQHAKEQMKALENVNGEAFDRRFAEQMVHGHKGAIAMLDKSKSKITDPQLRALLAELEPTLQSHEQVAANLLGEMHGVSTNEVSTPPTSAQGRSAPSTR